MYKLVTGLLAVVLLTTSVGSMALDNTDGVGTLQREWAIANYELNGDKQDKTFTQLIEKSGMLTEQHPEDAGLWIWDGIIKSTYAGVKGGLGALSLAKQSRKSLEKALEIDPTALDGSAYTSLGTLYFKVPGWPAGFGNNKKAEKMLQKALKINPDGIDSNYFYADYLRDRKMFSEAETYLLKAQQAAPRPDRPIADAGRHHEIQLALSEVRTKLDKRGN